MKTQKLTEQQDWHRADTKAALEKKGWSLRQLAITNGYHPDVFKNALARPYPRVERLIAEAIGVKAAIIWPTRYHDDGTAKSGRNERGIGVYKRKSTTQASVCNVEVQRPV
jgi:Ner family transcriptional regulator